MKINIGSYQPLIVVVLLALAMAVAVHVTTLSFAAIMTSFMGFFLCLLSLFKFFNLSGFVEGFSMYDVLTQRFRAYGFFYPFIESGLGLLYLGGCFPLFTNISTLAIMSLSAIGVIRSVRAGMNLRCACLGTVLSVPLSTVSIVENVGMSIMAAINIISLVSAQRF